MSTLREALGDYLAMRRALGFKLRSDGVALSSFVSFLEHAHADYISTQRALAWAQMPTSVQPVRWARRLCFVRGFARYCSAIDPRTEIPPLGLLPFHHQRPTPYRFTDEDIRGLLLRSLELPADDGLTNHTFYCLFGLLSVTGIRISEALRLTMDDVDLDEAVLIVHSSKFGKSRLVPLHASTVKVLVDYSTRRAQSLNGRLIPHWFVNRRGERLGYYAVLGTFRRLTRALGLVSQGRRRPRLHDLRHRFAQATLLQWYRNGDDVERRLPALSTYLGHVEIGDTYWYLSACPELLEAAKDRMEKNWERTP
jgi:integrase